VIDARREAMAEVLFAGQPDRSCDGDEPRAACEQWMSAFYRVPPLAVPAEGTEDIEDFAEIWRDTSCSSPRVRATEAAFRAGPEHCTGHRGNLPAAWTALLWPSSSRRPRAKLRSECKG